MADAAGAGPQRRRAPGDTAVVMATALRRWRTAPRSPPAARRSRPPVCLTGTTASNATCWRCRSSRARWRACARRRDAAAGPHRSPRRGRSTRCSPGARERLSRDAAVISARTRPQVSAFAQIAVGRPGSRSSSAMCTTTGCRRADALGAVQLGHQRRERALLRRCSQIVYTEEAASPRACSGRCRTSSRHGAAGASAETDERIIALREQCGAAGGRRSTSALNPPAYVDARTACRTPPAPPAHRWSWLAPRRVPDHPGHRVRP